MIAPSASYPVPTSKDRFKFKIPAICVLSDAPAIVLNPNYLFFGSVLLLAAVYCS
jgi:hypothetical protein